MKVKKRVVVRTAVGKQLGGPKASGRRREYAPKPLDNMRFGRRALRPIIDLRRPNQGIATKFEITELFVGKTAVLAPHCDDASLNYGGGIRKFADAGGDIHIINVSPGYRAPFPNITTNAPADIERKIATRVREGKREAQILGAKFHYLDLRTLYEQRRITSKEATKFYRALDTINPTTIVVPGPFDTHPDHRNVRILSLNWAAERAFSGRPVVVVEAPSMWGSIPETMFTHLLELDPTTAGIRRKAQRAHKSQWKRTNFPRVADFKARAHAIVGGELVHGLVAQTPILSPTEFYSQHTIVKKGNRLVLRRMEN